MTNAVASIAPIYVGYIWYFRSVPGEGVITAVTHTSLGEALELINLSGWAILVPVAWIICYLVLVFRMPTLQKKIVPRFKKVLCGLVVVYLSALVFSFKFASSNMDAPSAVLEGQSSSTLYLHTLLDERMLRDSFPLGLFLALADNSSQFKATTSNNFKFEAFKKHPIAEKEIYVLIIGETSRYQNWSVNGYSRPTSPKLDRLYRNGELISFADVAAAANATEKAGRMLVTRATPSTFSQIEKEGTVADAFREAGYKTGWISNQKFMYPASVDFSNFDWDMTRYDESMLPIIDRMLKQSGDKIFLIIHTKGSHADYDQRYPGRFKFFSPTLADLGRPMYCISCGGRTAMSSAVRGAMLNSYDNTIVATDDFIYRVIDLVDRRQAVSSVFYISDHGENLYDDDRRMFMHVTPHPSKVEIHVPAFLWTSEAYKARYAQKQRALLAHSQSKLSQDIVFHTLLDIADIGLPTENLSKSVASIKFVEPLHRYVLTPAWEVLPYESLR